jgi:YesN/AraC family two-component response regulator
VFEAKDGCECVALFKDEKPEFVITDMLMPHKDGLQTL